MAGSARQRTDHLTYLLIALLFGLIAILQSADVPSPSLFGAHADLLLVLVAAWALLRSSDEVMVAAPPAALLAGLLGAGPIGAPLLVLIAPVGLALLLRQRERNHLPGLVLLVAVSTIWALLITLGADFMSGQQALHLGGAGGVLLGAVVLNLTLALVIYWPLRFVRKRQLLRKAGLSLS